MRVCLGLVRGALVVIVCAAARVAAADELAWRAPADCPERSDVRARVELRLGVSLDIISAGGVVVDVVAREPGFVATIDVGGERERELVAASCGELADAVALVVARVELERGERRDVHARAPEPEPALAAVAAAPKRRSWQLGARAATLAGVALVPGVGFGGELAAFARVGLADVEIGAARWLTTSAEVMRGTVSRVDVDLAVATARIGGRLPGVPLRAWLVGELGAMGGTGVATDGRHAGSGRWLAGGVGFGTWTRVARATAIVVAAEVIDAARRPSFQLSDGTSLYEAPALSGRAWLGVEVAW